MSRPKMDIVDRHPLLTKLLLRQDEQELTNLKFAEMTGLTANKINRFRRGTQDPDVWDLVAMAKALKFELVLKDWS